MSAIILGGVTLNKSMVWLERQASNKVAQSVRYTIGGRAVVFSNGIVNGHQITLQATEEYGWLTKTQVDAIMALAAVPGAVYTLTFGSEVYSVMFRHEEPPAVSMEAFVPRIGHDSGDYFFGTIKLLSF